jgi:hypothetical protein
VEFRDFIWSVADISGVFPCIAFCSVAFPLDQVLEASTMHPAVQDSFYYVLFFPFDELRWRGWASTPAGDWVNGGTRQFHDVENRV